MSAEQFYRHITQHFDVIKTDPKATINNLARCMNVEPSHYSAQTLMDIIEGYYCNMRHTVNDLKYKKYLGFK